MRGQPLYNFPAFFVAAIRLRAQGHTVFNPAERDMAVGFDPSKDMNEQGFDLNGAFAWDFDAIQKSDAIVLLPGWKDSKGVAAELTVAWYSGKRIHYEYDPVTDTLTEICIDQPRIHLAVNKRSSTSVPLRS
jgi:hypothetical protein